MPSEEEAELTPLGTLGVADLAVSQPLEAWAKVWFTCTKTQRH